MNDYVQVGKTPFYFNPKQWQRQLLTVIAIVVLGFGFGWGHSLAFVAGGLVWSFKGDQTLR